MVRGMAARKNKKPLNCVNLITESGVRMLKIKRAYESFRILRSVVFHLAFATGRQKINMR